MNDPLHRLYRTKLALLATLLLFVGLGLLIFGHWIEHAAGWQWLSNWPIIDIGSGMFTTGLLGVALQYLDGEDSEVRDTERLKRVLTDSAPAMRDAVIGGFAFNPDDLARVATPEVLDRIITNGLAIRLGDAGFADEIYEDLRQQAIGIPERLHDARISIRLSMDRGTPNGRAPMFVATIRWEFSVIPTYQTRRFVCLSDLAEFRDLKQDTVATSAWYVGPRTGLDAAARNTFDLVEFTIDGEARPIRRSSKEGSQTYTVNLGHEAMEARTPIAVAYTYRTLVSRSGHLLQLRIDQPTRGLSIELDYSDTDIEFVNVLDFIASSQVAHVSRSSTAVPGRSAAVEFNGWALPRSGIAFVWTRQVDIRSKDA
jgi:hypothetical protein